MSVDTCNPYSRRSSFDPHPKDLLEKLKVQRTKIFEKYINAYPVKSICLNLVPRKENTSKNVGICLLCYENSKRESISIQEMGSRMLNNDMETVDETISRRRRKFKDIQNVFLEFQKNYKPWYIPDIQQEKIRQNERFFNMPNLILCIDPGFTDYQKIMRYIEYGVRFYYINLAKGTRSLQIKTLSFLKQVKASLPIWCQLSIVAQISDSYPVTGDLKYNATSIYLDRDSKFILTTKHCFVKLGTHEIVYANIHDYINYLEKKTEIRLGNAIVLEIVAIEKKNVACIVKKAGLLTPKMDINVADKFLWMESNISKIEELDINFAMKNGINCMVCPRADKITLCQYIKWVAASQKKPITVLGKLYPQKFSPQIIKNVLKECHGIWIADNRIKMTVELEKVVYEEAKFQNKPIIRDGGFITSEHIILPSLKLKKYYLLYPHCLVFHVNGKVNPLNIRSIIRENYPNMNKDLVELCCKNRARRMLMPSIMARHIALETIFQKVACIICIIRTGKLAILLANNCVVVPIITIGENASVARKLLLWRNVFPLLYRPKRDVWFEELNDRLSVCIKYCKEHDIIVDGSTFIVTFPSTRDSRHSDSFRILTLNCDNVAKLY